MKADMDAAVMSQQKNMRVLWEIISDGMAWEIGVGLREPDLPICENAGPVGGFEIELLVAFISV